jgi:hypothetical protein
MIADQDGPNIPKTKRIPDYSASLIPRWAICGRARTIALRSEEMSPLAAK